MNKRTEGKIKKDFGMSDYYKFYKKESKQPVSALKFNKVISEINQKIVDLIINESLDFTPIMLNITICIRKHKRVLKFLNNELINTYPIDWKTTKKIWEQNPEAAEKKILIRHLNNHTSKYIFRIKALKTGKGYINKELYKFKPCRSFQRLLAKRIFDPNKDPFEAYNLY